MRRRAESSVLQIINRRLHVHTQCNQAISDMINKPRVPAENLNNCIHKHSYRRSDSWSRLDHHEITGHAFRDMTSGFAFHPTLSIRLYLVNMNGGT